jgi:hypothetical protein
MNDPLPQAHLSAYGFTFTSVTSQTLGRAAESWEEAHVTRRLTDERVIDRSELPATGATDSFAWICIPEGEMVLRRDPALTVEWNLSSMISEDALVHPYLALPASLMNHWFGRTCLHGGALLVGDRAVVVFGDKEAGKSTTMATAATAGFSVLSDDLVVLDGTTLLAGPRSIDLREEAAKRFGGRPLGIVGDRPRWRLACPDGPAEAELAGFVRLAWGERLAISPLPARERLDTLFAQHYAMPGPGRPDHHLDLAAMPMFELMRPRRLDLVGEALRQIVTAFG